MRDIVMRLREDEEFAKTIYADCPRLQLLLEEHPDLKPIFEDPKLVRINFEKVYRDAGGVLPEDEKKQWFFMRWYNWIMDKVAIITNHPFFRIFKFLMIIKRVLGLLSPTKGLGAIKAFFTASFFENMEPPEAPEGVDIDLESEQAKAQLNAAADHMEDPEVQEKMQDLLEGDPEELEEEIENDKMLRDLRDSNELCSEMMADPETMKILVDPENLRALGECPDLIEQDFADGFSGGDGMDGGGMDVDPEVEAQEDALLDDIPEEEPELEEPEVEAEEGEAEGEDAEGEDEEGEDGEEEEDEEEEDDDGGSPMDDVEKTEKTDPKTANKNQSKAQKQQQRQQESLEEGEGVDKVAIAGMAGGLAVGALGSLGLDLGGFSGFGFGGGGAEDLGVDVGGGELEGVGDVGLEDPGLEDPGFEDPTEGVLDEDVAEAEDDLLEDLEGEEEEEEEEGGFGDNMQEEFEDMEGEEVEAGNKSKAKGAQQQQRGAGDPNNPDAPEGEKEGGGGIGGALWGATFGAAAATMVGAVGGIVGDDGGYLDTLHGAVEDHQDEQEEEEEDEDEEGKKAKGAGDGDADVADKKKKGGFFGAAGSILSSAVQDHIKSSTLGEILGDDAAEQLEDDLDDHEEEFEEEEEEDEDGSDKDDSDDEDGRKKAGDGGDDDDEDDRKPAARGAEDDDEGAGKPEEQKKRGAFSSFGRNK
uniref:Uncharacterized protein n=1 Tax=Grammatophora oceanica TaxID=210454 RepID=A0A7S1VSL0_9STRA